jgi:hypothetical protein
MTTSVFLREPDADLLKFVTSAANSHGIKFANSIKAAAQTLTAMRQHQTCAAIMFGNLQSGKTGGQLATVLGLPYFFAKVHGAQLSDVKVGVVLVTNKALTAIFTQTKDRLRAAGFKETPFSDDDHGQLFFTRVCEEQGQCADIWVEPVMVAGKLWDEKNNSGKFLIAMNKLREAGCTHFAFVMDEVHVAVKNDQQVDKFMASYLNAKSLNRDLTAFKPPMVFIGSTATPFKSFVFPEFSKNLIVSSTQAGEGYYGVKDLRAGFDINGQPRMKTAVPFTSVDEIVRTLKPYANANDPKYHVVRIQSMRESDEDQLFKDAAKKLKMKVMEFSSIKKNLKDLANRFNLKPKSNIMIIIKAGLGAGVTIETVENIGSWVDTAFNNFESLAQSLGRLCGYQKDRKLARFPIFCDVDKVDFYLKWIDSLEHGTYTEADIQADVGSTRSSSNWEGQGGFVKYELVTQKKYQEIGIRDGWLDGLNDRQDRALNISENSKRRIAEQILKGKLLGKVYFDGPPPFHLVEERDELKGEKWARVWRKQWLELCKLYPALTKTPPKDLKKRLVFVPTNLVPVTKVRGARRPNSGGFTR